MLTCSVYIHSGYSSSYIALIVLSLFRCTLIKRNVLLNTLNCTNLPGVNQVCASPDMSGTRPFLCTIDPKLFSAIIIGVFGALHECQNRFKNRPWNCSVFDQAPCQGKFTENGTSVQCKLFCVAYNAAIYVHAWIYNSY